MRRIKLNRPPPVSSEAAKDIASGNTVADSLSNELQNSPSGSQTDNIHVEDTSTVREKYPSDWKLISRENTFTTAEDTRRVKRKHSVHDARKEHCTPASEDVLQDVFVSDYSAKEAKKKQRRNVIQEDSVQMSLPGSDDIKIHYAAHHALASSGDGSSFCDSLFQQTVMHIEPQHNATVVNKKLTGSLLDDVLKGFLVKKLAAIENERKGTDVDYRDHDVEAVVQNRPKDFSPASKLRRHNRLRENDEQPRDLDYLPAKSRYRDSYQSLPQHDNEYTKAHSDANYTKSCLGSWPHAFIHSGRDHLSRRILHGFTDVINVNKHNFRTEGSSFKRDYRKRHCKPALHEIRHLEKKNRQTEHRPPSFDLGLPQLARSQSNEYDPLASCYEISASTPTHGRKRQNSGSTSSHHHHHHHHKKQKSANSLTDDKKRAKRGIGKKSVKTTKNVQEGILTSMHMKHKHRHHNRKTTLPDVQVDYKNLEKCETRPCVKAKDEDDPFNKSRSLSPLGVHRKHRKKHKKKKSSEKTVAQVSAQNVPLLPGESDTQYDKISSDEEFIPMKVQRSEDDDVTAGQKVLQKMDAEFIPMKIQTSEDDDVTPGLKMPQKMDTPNTGGVKHGQTNRKSAVEIQYKFLKVSGKRPKRQMHVSEANLPAEDPVPSDNVQNSGSVGEHPVQDAGEHLQLVEDMAVGYDTATETMAPSVAATQDCADQTSTSREVTQTANSLPSEEAIRCCDSDERRVMQTVIVNADHSSNEMSGDGHICSIDGLNMTSQRSIEPVADGDNLSESDKTLHLGENEHQGTTVETEKKASTHDNNDFTSKVVLSDTVMETVSEEEHATDEVCKSASYLSETVAVFHPDVEPDAVREKATTEDEDKDRTEVVKIDEDSAVKDEGQNSADQQGVLLDPVDPAGNCPLNQKDSMAASPTCVTTSGEDSSAVNTTDNNLGCSENYSIAPINVMGPPLALPPSMAFKKPLPVMKMRLRITDTSADMISSGVKTSEKDKKGRKDENREEGNPAVSVVDYYLRFATDQSVHGVLISLITLHDNIENVVIDYKIIHIQSSHNHY